MLHITTVGGVGDGDGDAARDGSGADAICSPPGDDSGDEKQDGDASAGCALAGFLFRSITFSGLGCAK